MKGLVEKEGLGNCGKCFFIPGKVRKSRWSCRAEVVEKRAGIEAQLELLRISKLRINTISSRVRYKNRKRDSLRLTLEETNRQRTLAIFIRNGDISIDEETSNEHKQASLSDKLDLGP